MKTYHFKKVISLTIFITLFGIIGCENFLKEDARNFINPDNFYKTQSDAESGVAGIYERISAGGIGLIYGVVQINNVNSEIIWPWSNTAWDVGYNFTPDLAFPKNMWVWSYDGIKRSNSFIEVMEKAQINFPENVRNRMLGEAKFLRAYFYYNLVQLYGDVPLVTKTFASSDDFIVNRDPAVAVWEFVKNDLLEAINLLPPKSAYTGVDIRRANKEAAKMMLAKVNMIQKDWTNAKKYVDEIVASNEYQLETDIFDNWRTANEHGKESIFEIDFGSGFTPSLGTTLSNLSCPAGLKHPITGQIVGGAFTGASYYYGFINSFAATDTRRKLFFDPATHTGSPGRFFTNKFFDFTVMTNATDGPVNSVVFRYADVLLMKAEIENELNNGPNAAAYDAIDKVRLRSSLPVMARVLNYNDFLNAVFVERAKELFFEGHSFYDLKRRGYAFLKQRVESARAELFLFQGFTGGFDVKESELVLPLPISELDANPNLVQNPGY